MMKSNFSTKTMCIEFRMYCTSFYIYIWYMALTKGCVSKLGDLSWWNKLYWMYCTETLATFFLGEKTLYQISGKIDSFKRIIHSPRCIFRHFTRPKSWKFSETSAMLRYDKDFFSHIRFGGTCSPFLFSRSIFLGPPFQKWTTIVTTSVTTISNMNSHDASSLSTYCQPRTPPK